MEEKSSTSSSGNSNTSSSGSGSGSSSKSSSKSNSNNNSPIKATQEGKEKKPTPTLPALDESGMKISTSSSWTILPPDRVDVLEDKGKQGTIAVGPVVADGGDEGEADSEQSSIEPANER